MNGTAVIDFDTDVIKVMLWGTGLTLDYSGDVYVSDLTGGSQVTGTNYTAGGATLGSKSLTESGGTVTFDAADVTWTQSGTGFNNAYYAIIYKDTGNTATSPLIGLIDLTGPKGNVSGDLTIQWGGSGIATWA